MASQDHGPMVVENERDNLSPQFMTPQYNAGQSTGPDPSKSPEPYHGNQFTPVSPPGSPPPQGHQQYYTPMQPNPNGGQQQQPDYSMPQVLPTGEYPHNQQYQQPQQSQYHSAQQYPQQYPQQTAYNEKPGLMPVYGGAPNSYQAPPPQTFQTAYDYQPNAQQPQHPQQPQSMGPPPPAGGAAVPATGGDKSGRICGLKKKIFWILLVVAIIIVLGAGLGAGLGVALGNKKHNNTPAQAAGSNTAGGDITTTNRNGGSPTPTPTESIDTGPLSTVNPSVTRGPAAGATTLTTGTNTLSMTITSTTGTLCPALILHPTTVLTVDLSGPSSAYTLEYYAAEFPTSALTQTFTAGTPSETNGLDLWTFEGDVSNSVNKCYYTGDFAVVLTDTGVAAFGVNLKLDSACSFSSNNQNYDQGASCQVEWVGVIE